MASYTVLYRKYRPKDFSEVKGQDAIVTTLKNQIKTGRIGHAYLLCGTRGTGKTTLAKIFAKAVNCEHPVDGNPCGVCPTCMAIAGGVSMDVVEIDAASNNGVDDIRQLREDVKYPPASARYRVYIIDEAHMITQQAFNALLKTLEEPPSYVIFILATTDPNRLPITILSRCQRYDLKRIPADTVTDRLEEILKAEGIEAEERALRYIAKTADGSFRDALSLLEQCISYYIGEEITYERVLDILGAVDTVVFRELLCNIVAKDTARCMELVEDMVMSGRELGQFVTDFIWYLRNLLLLKTSRRGAELIDASDERRAGMEEEATILEIPELMRYIRIFSDLENQMKYSSSKRVLFEVAVIRLMRPEMDQDLSAAYGRIANLEREVRGLAQDGRLSASLNTTLPGDGGADAETAGGPDGSFDGTRTGEGDSYADSLGVRRDTDRKSPARQPRKLDPATREDLDRLKESFFDRIVSKMADGMMKVYLRQCEPVPTGEDHLTLNFTKDPEQKENMAYSYMLENDRVQELEARIADETGKQVFIDLKLIEPGTASEDEFLSSLQHINWGFIEEEEE